MKGGIFDLDVTEDDDNVGFEFDLTLSWPILSDMTVDVEYGHFEPGDAYPATGEDDAEYLSVAITTTF